MSTASLVSLTLLVIGESHMALPQYLINPLHDDLQAEGAKVYSIGACGASAGDWLKITKVDCSSERSGDEKAIFKAKPNAATTPYRELVAKYKPNVVVMIIGDTMGAYDKDPYPRAWAWQSITNLTKEIAASKVTCVWVGPTWGRDGGRYLKTNPGAQRVSEFISRNVSPCIYIDSLKMSKIDEWKTIDGDHLNGPGYKNWAAAITKAIGELPEVQKLRK